MAKKTTKTEEKKALVFDLDEIGYTDLKGNRMKLDFDKEIFADVLYANATGIKMDGLARAIFKDGKGETDAETLQIIPAILDNGRYYSHRAKEAIKEYINNLIK